VLDNKYINHEQQAVIGQKEYRVLCLFLLTSFSVCCLFFDVCIPTQGGLPSHAFEYLKERGGMVYELQYPYRASDSHTCVVNNDENSNSHENKKRAKVAAVYNISSRNEHDLVTAVAQIGPVSVAYQVAPDFRFYSHGVYDSFRVRVRVRVTTVCKDSAMDVNHAVVAVGLGVTKDDKQTPYYIIRNSWSANWGMEGHFWMLRGTNLCGISDCASFPIVPGLAAKMKMGVDAKQITN
jgi:cathepsin H